MTILHHNLLDHLLPGVTSTRHKWTSEIREHRWMALTMARRLGPFHVAVFGSLASLTVCAAASLEAREECTRTGTKNKNRPSPVPPEPNPPAWPPSVHVFAPGDANLTQRIAAVTATLNDRADGHFSDERLALLFKVCDGNNSRETQKVDDSKIGDYPRNDARSSPPRPRRL